MFALVRLELGAQVVVVRFEFLNGFYRIRKDRGGIEAVKTVSVYVHGFRNGLLNVLSDESRFPFCFAGPS